MMRHSRESYAIIYTRQDVHIFRDSEYSIPAEMMSTFQ